MKTLKKYSFRIEMACAVLLLALFILYRNNTPQATGSVSRGGEYHATTTANAKFPALQNIIDGTGTFGSVIVTGSQLGTMNFYDATTTNVLLRTGNIATSSLLIASFPTNVSTGTYTFDIGFRYGLFAEWIGNSMPTTTITWRE